MSSNPWLKKNPFMSMWLSAANSVANTARGQATRQARRNASAAAAQAGSSLFSFWTQAAGLTAKSAHRKKR